MPWPSCSFSAVTKTLLEELSLSSIPLKRGADTPFARSSPASRYLRSALQQNPGEIIVLSTGSPVNLFGAMQEAPGVLNLAREIVVMGGITDPLCVGGKRIDELNLSSDPEASFQVLVSGAEITVITGNLCLEAVLNEDDLRLATSRGGGLSSGEIGPALWSWFDWFRKEFGVRGFYLWDVAAAVWAVSPELFSRRKVFFASDESDLRTGLIRTRESGGSSINLPERITDSEGFHRSVFDAWKRAGYSITIG